MNLTTASPAAIDTRLAELNGAIRLSQSRREATMSRAHHVVGDRRDYRQKDQPWTLSDSQTLVRVAHVIDNDQREFSREDAQSVLDDLRKFRLETVELSRQIAELETEFYRRGTWSRFFHVPAGHIHSSMACSTCYVTTQFGWNPDLSGMTEADAVAKLGPVLCTVCFPSAPVEWRRDRADVKSETEAESGLFCGGSGGYADDIKWYASPRGRCRVCNKIQGVTSTGKVRKHQSEAAAKAAHADEAGRFRLNGRTENYKTVRAAQIALVDHLASHRAWDYRLDVDGVAALSERLGAMLELSSEDFDAMIEAKVAAKIKRDQAEVRKLQRG